MTAAARGEATLADDFAADVRKGLAARPKRLPPRWFYDELGSLLFDAITLLPEYYPTRTEQAILDRHVEGMLARVPEEVALVELGAGSGTKTRTVIRALLERQGALTYCPIDISEAALRGAGATLGQAFPGLAFKPIVGRYRQGLAMLRGDPRRKLVLFLGSSLGNYDPAEATRLLADVRAVMGPGDRLLLGTDLAKDPAVLQAAYDDPLGVTAAFNRNVLGRINRELGGDLDLGAFDHRATWNPAKHRMEMHLVSRTAQAARVRALDLAVRFEAGEGIHTENSYKYTEAMLAEQVGGAGLSREASWHDDRRWFALHLLAPAAPRRGPGAGADNGGR